MHLDYRYTPDTEYLGFEEFGDRFFTDGINYEDDTVKRTDKIYPLAWDNKLDRDLVWLTKEVMTPDYIEGVKSHTTCNPICIIDLKKNIESFKLNKVWEEQYKDTIKYYQSFVDKNYNFYVFIGKNRVTLPFYQIWVGIKNKDPKFDIFKEKRENGKYKFRVEFKVFTEYVEENWRGEYYRGEKTIYPDSPIMIKLSYSNCKWGNWIYKWTEKEENRKLFFPTWNNDAFIQAKPKEFIDSCIYYVENEKYAGSTNDMNHWINNDKLPTNFSSSWALFEEFYKYLPVYFTDDKGKVKLSEYKSWVTENRLRLLFTICHYLNNENLKPTKKIGKSDKRDWSDTFDAVIEFIIAEQQNEEVYGFSARTALDFNQLLSGLKVGGDVYEKRRKVGKREDISQLVLIQTVLDKLYAKLLDNDTLRDIDRRKPKSPGLGYSLFLQGDRRLRCNGLDKNGEWYKGPKDPLYTDELTFKQFIQMSRNLDHIDALADGGSDSDLNNFEWATEDYNVWKSNRVIVN